MYIIPTHDQWLLLQFLVEIVRNLVAHGNAREGKWSGNWRMEWVASTLTPPPDVVYPALLKLMRTTRLPAVDWTDAPHRFAWTRPFRRKTKSGFCACVITFRTSYTTLTADASELRKERMKLPRCAKPPLTVAHSTTTANHPRRSERLMWITTRWLACSFLTTRGETPAVMQPSVLCRTIKKVFLRTPRRTISSFVQSLGVYEIWKNAIWLLDVSVIFMSEILQVYMRKSFFADHWTGSREV